VTHEDCIAILLRPEAAPSERQGAEEHIGRCSDCWAVLSLVHELAMGQPPADAGRMGVLFGCGPVQEQMYLLAGLSAAEIKARHPELARHLGWCHACRDRLAEIVSVERAAARGELGAPLFAPEPRWRTVPGRVGEAVREFVGRAVADVRRAGAVFTALPEGFLSIPMAAPAGALRGTLAATEPALAQQVRFPLPESELWAELTLESEGGGRLGVGVRLSGAEGRRLSICLREVGADRTELVARYTAHEGAPVLVRNLLPGQYLLEIEDKEQARRFQLRFDVEASA
jgi:hypothetical protein